MGSGSLTNPARGIRLVGIHEETSTLIREGGVGNSPLRAAAERGARAGVEF